MIFLSQAVHDIFDRTVELRNGQGFNSPCLQITFALCAYIIHTVSSQVVRVKVADHFAHELYTRLDHCTFLKMHGSVVAHRLHCGWPALSKHSSQITPSSSGHHWQPVLSSSICSGQQYVVGCKAWHISVARIDSSARRRVRNDFLDQSLHPRAQWSTGEGP